MSTETNKIRQEYLTGERALFQAKEMEISALVQPGYSCRGLYMV